MATWVDFKELRRELRFADVLKHYNVELKVKGDRAQGFCPFPGHQGQKRSPSFSAHLVKGIFQCFSCGASGNVLDFAVRMEGLNPDDPPALRKVALQLQDKFLGSKSATPPVQLQRRQEGNRAVAAGDKLEPKKDLPVVVNAPLDFELKHLDAGHEYLKQRGMDGRTVAHFGLGFCSRGLLAGRIAIPLHDADGKLIGYAGRIVDGNAIDEEHPKYLFPPPRQRDGRRCEFHKSLFLYRGFDCGDAVPDLIIVEGFPATWWLWQHGYRSTVALMGSSCSPEQATLFVKLVKPGGRVWLIPDGDDAGLRCAESVLSQVAPHHFIRWVKLDQGKQPTDCLGEELAALLPADFGRREAAL